jgi:hypothetical protein
MEAYPVNKVGKLSRSTPSFMSERDLSLLRELFLDVVGPDHTDITDFAATDAGAPKLSKDQLDFLKFAEAPGATFADMTGYVEKMAPETLVACASVAGEMLVRAARNKT